jgi:hypothetical protein
MVSAYIVFIGNIISGFLRKLFREDVMNKHLKSNILFCLVSTFSYTASYNYDNKDYLYFIMSMILLTFLCVYFIRNVFTFFNKDISTQLEKLKEKKNIQFYFSVLNPNVHFYFVALILGFSTSILFKVHFLYKLGILLVTVQILAFVFRQIFSEKLAYFDYLTSIINSEGFNRIVISELKKYDKIRIYSLFEVYILDHLLYTNKEIAFFLINKINNNLSRIYKIKGLIYYKMYSLLKIDGDERNFLTYEENCVIDVLKNIQLNDYFKAQLIFDSMSDVSKEMYSDLKSIIEENKEISFDSHYDDVDYYIINDEDFSRSNSREMYFHKFLKFKLLAIFDNKCVKTGKTTEIEMDHFFIPKSHGGNFILKRKDGAYVLNVIPLHKTVNQEKSNKDYRNIFTPAEIDEILVKINHLNVELNNIKGLDL